MAGRWPLYYFAADAAPGDVHGQASGDVWFVVGRDARLVRSGARPSGPKASPAAAAAQAPGAPAPSTPDPAPVGGPADGYGYSAAAPGADTPVAAPAANADPPAAEPPSAPTDSAPSVAVVPAARPLAPPAVADLALADSRLGRIVVNRVGSTLYVLTDDSDGVSTCEGRCAATWPPAAPVGSTPSATSGIDQSSVTVATRADGSAQLTLGGSPLYTFVGDARPGDTNGQGSGGVWFVIGADGQPIGG